MVPSDGQLETTIEVVTPENISFQYRVAGPFRRSLAFLIDFMIRFAVVMMALFLVAIFGVVGLQGFGIAIWLVIWFLLTWFYGGILEAYWNGQTVGKRLMGLRVLTAEGQPINATQAVMRNILRVVDSLPPPTGLAGLVAAMMNPRFQRLGDLVCGTVVVVEDREWQYGLAKIDDAAAIRLAADLPASFDVPRTLGYALTNYVDRRRFFSPGRRYDLARRVAEPLRHKFSLPPDTDPDLLLCALYYRTFVTDQAELPYEPAREASPPAAPSPPAPVTDRIVIDTTR